MWQGEKTPEMGSGDGRTVMGVWVNGDIHDDF